MTGEKPCFGFGSHEKDLVLTALVACKSTILKEYRNDSKLEK